MEIKTLQSITTELNGRSLNPALESYLPQYVRELSSLLSTVHAVTQKLPTELAPAGEFVLKPGTTSQFK